MQRTPFGAANRLLMLTDLRVWLESELQTLAHARDGTFAAGQRDMAKRALERLERETSTSILVPLDRQTVVGALTALGMLEERDTSLAPALATLRNGLRSSLDEPGG